MLKTLAEFWNQGCTNLTTGIGKCSLSILWRIWFCLSSSSKYFIIEHLVEFSGKELDFCPTNPEGAKPKLKLPIMFFNVGKSSQAVLVLSDFTNLFGIRLSLRICLTFPSEFVWHFPTILFIYFKLVFYLFLAVLDLCCFAQFSLAAVSASYSLVIDAQASHCSGFSCRRAQALSTCELQQFQHTGSLVVAYGL